MTLQDISPDITILELKERVIKKVNEIYTQNLEEGPDYKSKEWREKVKTEAISKGIISDSYEVKKLFK